jgi:hypothetical protein
VIERGGVGIESIGFLSVTFLSWHVKGRKSSGLVAVFVRDGAVDTPSNCIVSLGELNLNFVDISRDREGEGRDAPSGFCDVERINRRFFSVDCHPLQLTEFSVDVLVIEAP